MPPSAPVSERLLLDREKELGEVVDRLQAACSGSGSAMLLEGPGGIGKTELLLAAERAARRRGMVAATARGAELEREFAFGVVRQLFEPAVSGPGGPALFDGAAALAAPVFESPAAGSDRGVVAERSFAVLHGLYWLCANLADRAPLLLAVDDVHWSDPPSLEFVSYLARRVGELRVALLVASRPGEEAVEALLEEVGADPRALVLRPKGLGPDAVAALVRAQSGQTPDSAFLAACRAATDGNPFLVRELAREVGEHGIVPAAAEAERVRELGPRTVARRLLARLGRTSPFAVPVVRAAAVLGVDADVRHVARLAELAAADVAAALDSLEAAGIVTGDRPVRFVHPIVRSAIYAAMAEGERARLHGLAASLLRAEGATPERVASHLLLVEPAGDADTVELFVAAAREALARGAPSSATSYLRRALAEPPPADARPALMAELGSAESLVGDARAIEHLREALERATDAEPRRLAAVALARFMVLSGEPGQASAIFPEAGTGSERWALRLEASAVAAGIGDAEAASRMSERLAVLRARAEEDPDVPPVVFAALAIADAQGTTPADHVAALAERAMAGHERRGLGWATGLVAVFTALMFAERYDRAGEAVEEGLAIGRARGSAVHFAMCSAMRGCLALRRGALGDAEEDARAALDAAPRQAHGFYGMFALATLVESLVERGRLDEAEHELERIGVPAQASAATYGALLHARGRLRLAQQRAEEALADFLTSGRHLTRALCVSPSAVPWRSGAALAELVLGRPEVAHKHAAEEVTLAREVGAPRALGVSLRAASLAEGGDEGLALLEESVSSLEASQAPLELARSLAELGAALRRGGRRSEAREHLRRALDLAHRCGGERVAEQAHTDLLATGARPRRELLTGPRSLTASERRVARLAAQGLTNREVAQALFVSLRTVETHLTHAFQKLGIDSRNQLAEALEDVATTPKVRGLPTTREPAPRGRVGA
jgi:DNA-binding CsgD family transcriptional regulator/predicted negative regulator of RcsB-dependent stress response